LQALPAGALAFDRAADVAGQAGVVEVGDDMAVAAGGPDGDAADATPAADRLRREGEFGGDVAVGAATRFGLLIAST
jgi:hypothetical protein